MNGSPNDENGISELYAVAMREVLVQDRFPHIEEVARQLEPTCITDPVPQYRDGESSHALSGEGVDLVGDVLPILQEKPELDAF